MSENSRLHNLEYICGEIIRNKKGIKNEDENGDWRHR